MDRMAIVAQRSDPVRRARPWIAPLAALLLGACAAAPQPAAPPSQTDRGAKTVIFVTSNGWHTGVVLARPDLPPDRLPEMADFPAARFFEFGWGDAVYYPARQTTLGMTLRAGLVPTPSVMHVAGLSAEPARAFPEAEVVALPIGDQGLARLVDFIDTSFERQGLARATATGPGLYATSRFYPATGRFYIFNTSNTWTARALAAAGFDVSPAGVFQAEAVMRQVRALVAPR
jgi:uncharacterized protein (TIGR02117 family)